MPLEVSASLGRSVAVFLAGEVIQVQVTVKNVTARVRESLAWGSVQLTCERTIGAQAALADRPTTAISRSASTVYSSLPVILFCDVQLNPGEQQQFTSEISLPSSGMPPSFRGHLVKYLNRITVAVQHVRAPIRLIHLPVRVIPAVGHETKATPDANPFLAETMQKATVSEMVTSWVDEITAPRKPHVFNMTNTSGRVTTLTLYKKAFRLGEDILGHVNFKDSNVRCVQYSVSLEAVERLVEDTIGDDGEKRSEGRTHCVVHAQDHSVCAFAEDSGFRLGVPLQAPPSFHTDTVHVKWRLRFEFVTCDQLMQANPHGITTAPNDVPIETLTWQVDVFVLPCSAENAALVDTSHPGTASLVI